MLYYKGKTSLNLASTAGVLLLIPALSYCLHPDIIRYSIPEFITIRRILVSNGWGASATPLYPGIVYMPDLKLGYGNRQLGTSTLIPDLDGFI